METLSRIDVQKICSDLKAMALDRKEYLIELDSVMGDGDLGLTMAAVFTAADALASTYEDDDIGSLFMKAGMAMAKAAPSTMGTLMATGFMRGGKAVKGKSELTLADMAHFWRAFTDGIAERGKSKVGDKTILDALEPAARSLEAHSAQGSSLAAAMDEAQKEAFAGVEATKNLIAQHGRAAYYQEKSRSAQDPGATIGALVIAVFAEYLK